MVGFKGETKDKINKVMGNLIIFISGFIIATFLVLYIVLHIVANLSRYNVIPGGDTSNSEPPTSSEPYTSSIDSSIDYSESSIIINNLLDLARDYDDKVEDIININYDSSELYLVCTTSDDYIEILSGSYLSSIEECLETLIISKDDFSIDTTIYSYPISEEVDIDISDTEAFKSDARFNGYTYSYKYQTYIDTSKDEASFFLIGKNEDKYISIIDMYYVKSTGTISREGYISPIDIGVRYNNLLGYLYSLQ